MNLIIRKAKKNDMKSVLLLIKELAVFEREPLAVELTKSDLIRDGFSNSLFIFFKLIFSTARFTKLINLS